MQYNISFFYQAKQLTYVQGDKVVLFVADIMFLFTIAVNASDNKQRDPSMTCIKIDIDA